MIRFRKKKDSGSLIDEELKRRDNDDKLYAKRMKAEALKREYAERKEGYKLDREIRGLKASNRKLKFAKVIDAAKKTTPVARGVGRLSKEFHKSVAKNVRENKRRVRAEVRKDVYSKPKNGRRLI